MYYYTAVIAALAATTVNGAPVKRTCQSGVTLLDCGPGVVGSPSERAVCPAGTVPLEGGGCTRITDAVERLMPLERVCPEGQTLSSSGDCVPITESKRMICPLDMTVGSSGKCEPLPIEERAIACPPGTIRLEGGACSRLPTERSMPIETVCPLGQSMTSSGACEPLPVEERAIACPPGTIRLEGGACSRLPTKRLMPIETECPEGQELSSSGACEPIKESKRMICPLDMTVGSSGKCEPLQTQEERAVACPPGTIRLEGGACSRLPTTESKRLMPLERVCPEGQTVSASGDCEPITAEKRMMCPMDSTVGANGQCEPLPIEPINERATPNEIGCPPGTILTSAGECKTLDIES